MPEQLNEVGRTDAADRPVSEITRDIIRDAARIIRAEVRLVRSELGESARAAAEAGRGFAVTAVAGFLSAACFTTACVVALALFVPLWLSALVIGILLALVAGGAFTWSRQKLIEIDPVPHRTLETLKEDLEWTNQSTT
ncbi:MAG TPA: phage holin family protein [Candidatus Acidoferrales bacterium]|nr:phage holin family protein [Candidatus Acidoferrales bacterium]